MELRLHRRYKGPEYTIGDLYINGIKVCETLEDKDRGLYDSMSECEIIRKKIYGKTAIPMGRYRISMDIVSPKFAYRIWASPYGGKLPRLLNVKGYSGALIHVGNTQGDTDGCILCGWNKVKGQVVESTKTFAMLMDKYLIPARERNEAIYIKID